MAWAGHGPASRRPRDLDHHSRQDYASNLRARVPYDAISGVAVPLIHEDLVLGVISLGRAGADATFTETEREVLAIVGSQAALAMANAYLVEEVSALAIHDGLTGLYNRRHFDAAADLAIARFRRRGADGNLAAIMFDLDHFGQFNRLHGHLAGDEALRLFGGILRERLRSADLVARYGGEEFVAILEDCRSRRRRQGRRGRSTRIGVASDRRRGRPATSRDRQRRVRRDRSGGPDDGRAHQPGRRRAVHGQAGRSKPGGRRVAR